MKQVAFALGTLLPTLAIAQSHPSAVELPGFGVYSTRVALQEPSSTFAMPVSALRYEPMVDVQARNLAEGQSDVTIRGGTFENTGFKVGAISMYDPLTGHFFAEIPIAPAMLGLPQVRTGAENALLGWNANTGSVAYQWRPIRTAGAVTASLGDYATWRGEVYQGWVSPQTLLGKTFAADASIAASASDGSRAFGEHDFDRSNVRLQLRDKEAQTDLFYGYQAKRFGWPNLYTPYANVFETDALQTVLAALNHREELGGGDYINAGVGYRRNKDHYVFNRADAGAYNPRFATGPAFHTAWTANAGVEGRLTTGEIHWNVAGQFIAEKIRSTSLNFGRNHARDQYKVSVASERTWTMAGGRTLTFTGGGAWEDSNREGGAVSPVAKLQLGRLASANGVESVYVSYAKTTQLPTFFALNSRASAGLFRGNPNLGREVAHTWEAGLHGRWGRWSANGAVFFRRDDQLVDWTYASSLPNARAANAVDIDNIGAEAILRYESEALDLVFGYTTMDKDEDYGLVTVDSSFYALNYARHRFTAAVTWRMGHGFELHVDNEIRFQNEDALRTSSNNAFLTSAGVFYAPPRLPRLRFGVEVENAWDSEYQEVPAVPAARRQVSGSVTYSW